MKQLIRLLNTAGKRLVSHFTWERLVREFLFTTDARDPQDYDLPPDFAYMLDQTGWLRDQNVPLTGPLSAQEWQYLKGRNLVSSTIYASFRLNQGKLRLFPSESLINQDIAYEYMSENWVQPSGVTDQDLFVKQVATSSDVVLYPDPLPMLYLKARWLGAKGMDTSRADAEFSDAFLTWSGLDKSARTVSLSSRTRWGRWPVYMNGLYNTPDTGYGGI